MEHSLLWLLAFQLLLIALNAIFACAEIAVISTSDVKLSRLAEDGDRRAQRLLRLTNPPARFLATIQVAITLSGFLGSAFAAENFSDPLVTWLAGLGVPLAPSTLDAISVVIITIFLSYVTLIFGELVPKRIAMRNAETIALRISGLISAIARLFAPLVWLLTKSTNSILRLLNIDPNAEDEEVSEEAIRILVDAGGKKGAIDPEEQAFIQNVFEFDDLTAGEIATHRTDLVLLWLEDDMTVWEQTIRSNCHSYFPICDTSVDDVVGILYTSDYFRLIDRSRESVMRHAVRPAYFVPDSVKADVLFRNLRHEHQRLAIVLDEYSGVSGIVTRSDLIEQLVGDLGDNVPAHPAIEPLANGTWKVYGSTPLDVLSNALGFPIGHPDYDTFNGLVFSALGTVPQDGAQPQLTIGRLHIEVLDIRDHVIASAIVSCLPTAAESQE